jgi:carbonic anhydrase
MLLTETDMKILETRNIIVFALHHCGTSAAQQKRLRQPANSMNTLNEAAEDILQQYFYAVNYLKLSIM